LFFQCLSHVSFVLSTESRYGRTRTYPSRICLCFSPASVCLCSSPTPCRVRCVAARVPRPCGTGPRPDPAGSLLLLLAPRFWFLSLSCKLQPRSNLSFSLLRYHSIGSHAPCTHLSLARPRALVLGLWFRLRCQPRAPCASRSTPSDSRGACG
jgi:hypothetical protein